jgi:hypothetical protein
MNPMCAFRSSGFQLPIAQSPVPLGAFIISMNFIAFLLEAPVTSLPRRSLAKAGSFHR